MTTSKLLVAIVNFETLELIGTEAVLNHIELLLHVVSQKITTTDLHFNAHLLFSFAQR